MRILLGAFGSALMLSGWAVVPDCAAPAPPPAASGPLLSLRAGVTTNASADAQWWRLYKDPVLDRLVADALAANTDLRDAVARLAQARAAPREGRGDRPPSPGSAERTAERRWV